MKFSRSAFVASVCVMTAKAHMFMSSPVPIEGSAPKDPLIADGSNFPCHGVTPPGSGGQSMPVGSSQLLAWDTGNGANTAVHGGGSCQISVTYETDPEKIKEPSAWKVIYSIEEGCPTNSPLNLDGQFTGPKGSYTGSYPCTDDRTNGYDCVNQFNFTIPEGLQNGQATLAWTWFNNVGNREMYMNCAAIDISGGSDDDSAMSELPDMFVANLVASGLPTCDTEAYFNVQFPNPGQYVTTRVASSNMPVSSSTMSYPIAIPSGCSGDGGSSGTDSGSESAATTTAVASSETATLTYSAVQAGVTSAAAATTTSAQAEAETSTVQYSTMSTVTGYSPAAAATTSDTDVSAAAPTAESTGTYASSGNGTSSDSCDSGTIACPTPGALICVGSTQFGLCNINYCAVPQDLSDGTTCSDGVVSKRDVIRRSNRYHGRFAGNAHRHNF